MHRFILNQENAYLFVNANKYLPDPSKKILSRDINGLYPNSPELPPVAFPGGDFGELAVFLSAANIYGFQIDTEKLLKTYISVIGIENFSLAQSSGKGFTYYEQLISNFKDYTLMEDQMEFLKNMREDLVSKGAHEIVFNQESNEGALFFIKGKYALYPTFELETEDMKVKVSAYLYHQTFIDERHLSIAKKLLENKAVTLFEGLDENYLSEVLSTTAEDHLFETMKRVAKGVPIYEVTFKDDGSFAILDLEKV